MSPAAVEKDTGEPDNSLPRVTVGTPPTLRLVSKPDPVRFLTPEWAAALEAEANASGAFRSAAAGVSLTIQQEILPDSAPADEGSEGASEAVRYALTFEDGALSVTWGGVGTPDVTFVQSRDTAERIQRGDLNAQQAFVLGKLRVRGSPERLLRARDAFVGLVDVFTGLRERTTV